MLALNYEGNYGVIEKTLMIDQDQAWKIWAWFLGVFLGKGEKQERSFLNLIKSSGLIRRSKRVSGMERSFGFSVLWKDGLSSRFMEARFNGNTYRDVWING